MHGKMKLRPWEIVRMTIPEITLALNESTGPSGASVGRRFASHEERLAWAERRRRMTPREKLADSQAFWKD